MANITVAQLAAYLGIESRDSDQTTELQTFLDAASATVEKRAPGALWPFVSWQQSGWPLISTINLDSLVKTRFEEVPAIQHI